MWGTGCSTFSSRFWSIHSSSESRDGSTLGQVFLVKTSWINSIQIPSGNFDSFATSIDTCCHRTQWVFPWTHGDCLASFLGIVYQRVSVSFLQAPLHVLSWSLWRCSEPRGQPTQTGSQVSSIMHFLGHQNRWSMGYPHGFDDFIRRRPLQTVSKFSLSQILIDDSATSGALIPKP